MGNLYREAISLAGALRRAAAQAIELADRIDVAMHRDDHPSSPKFTIAPVLLTDAEIAAMRRANRTDAQEIELKARRAE